MKFIQTLKHLNFMQILTILTALIVLRIFTVFLPGGKKPARPEAKP